MEETKEQNCEQLLTDWHSGFAGGIGLGFRRYRGQIEIEREHLLSKAPLKIDYLLLNKSEGIVIDNDVGRSFQKYNVIEYKNPDDNLTIDVVWKIIGYASIYKCQGDSVNGIPIEEITATVLRSRKPVKLFKYLKKQGFEVKMIYPGVYHLKELVCFPIQVVVTRELQDDDFLALRIMRKKADEQEVKQFIRSMRNYCSQGEKLDMDAVLRVTAATNKELFEKLRGEEAMNDVLREIMMDDILAAEEQGEVIKLIKMVKRKIEKGKTPDEIALDLDEDIVRVRSIFDAIVSLSPESTPKDIYLKLEKK